VPVCTTEPVAERLLQRTERIFNRFAVFERSRLASRNFVEDQYNKEHATVSVQVGLCFHVDAESVLV
jgi:hypothetical protein